MIRTLIRFLICPAAFWSCQGWAMVPTEPPRTSPHPRVPSVPSLPLTNPAENTVTPSPEEAHPEDDTLRAGLKAEAALRAFLSEHPRWLEEEHGPPRMRRLLDQALDAYLRIVWNGVARAPVAARALWHAHHLARLCGDTARATHFAEDLTRSHPNSPYAQQASLFLQHTLPPRTAPPKTPSNPPPAEQPPAASRRGSRSR